MCCQHIHAESFSYHGDQYLICSKLAAGYIEAFEKIGAHFEAISLELRRLVEQENRFKSGTSKPLADALFKVFNAYWTFFEDVYNLLWSKKRSKPRAFGSHLKDFLTGKVQKVEGDVETFQKLCEEARKEIAQANDLRRDDENAQLLRAIELVESKMTQQDKEAFRRECVDFKKWLARVDMNSKMESELKKRTADTGEWIFRDVQYRRWAHGRRVDGPADTKIKQVLWISAGPGFGKSSLMAFLAHDVRRILPTGVAYFAFDSNSEFNSVSALLRTVAHQLFLNDTPIGEPHFAIEPSTMMYGYQDGLPLPDVDSLTGMLLEKARHERKTTIVMIDALDECEHTEDNERDMQKLFEFIAELPDYWRILVSSRLSPWFKHDLAQLLQSKLDRRVLTKDDNNADISAYILDELDMRVAARRLRWDDAFRAEVEQTLERKSQGMFKWTTLVLNDRRGLGGQKAMLSMPEARKALDNVPQGVLDIYKKTLQRLSEIEDELIKDDMTRALRWILRSYRPMRIAELRVALGVRDGLGERDQLVDQLGEHLGDLLYVDMSNETVGVTHTSARDFLTASPRHVCPNGEQLVNDRLEEIDVDLLQACVQHLIDDSRPFFRAEPVSKETDRNFAGKLDNVGFLEYAAIGWIHHLSTVCRAGLLNEEIIDDLRTLFSQDNSMQLLKWLQAFSFVFFTNRNGAAEAYSILLEALSDQPSGAVKPLADLLRIEFSGLIQHLGWADGGRFLRWQKLLAVPVPPCLSPTLLAAFFNYRPALETMIDGNETLHYHGRSWRPSAPFWAASGDATDTLALLLSDEHVGKFPDHKHQLRGRNGSSVLKEAVFVPRNIVSRPGTFPSAMLLVDKGCYVSYDFETLMLENVANSPSSGELVAHIMRKIPPAFTFEDDSVGNALTYASWSGQSYILEAMAKNRRLLGRMIESATGKKLSDELLKLADHWLLRLATYRHRGMSPIHHAAAINDARAIRLLCHDNQGSKFAGSETDGPCIDNGWTPLHLACQRGREKLRHRKGQNNEILTDREPIEPSEHALHALTAAGHSWDRTDDAGNLPIHLAAYSICDDVVSWLSDGSYDWDKPNNEGKTALAIALELRNWSMAGALLHRGAHVDRLTRHARSFLKNDGSVSEDITPQESKSAWIKCVLSIRAYAKRWIPIPIIARIIRFKELSENMIERHDLYGYQELTPDMPYLLSPPIQPNINVLPVKRVTITVKSARDPNTGRFAMEKTWSSIRTDKLDASNGRLIPWHERSIIRHNYCTLTEETVVFDASKAKDTSYLKGLSRGDRIVISPVTIYPAWYANIHSARIAFELTPALREALSNQDRGRLWPMADLDKLENRPMKVKDRFKRLRNGEEVLRCLPGRRCDDLSTRPAKIPLRRT